MKVNTESSLRKELEQMATEQLDSLLQQELTRDMPDEETVLTIMEILREREAAHPVQINRDIYNAWADFQNSCAADQAKSSAHKRNWVMRAAAIAAVVCILIMTVPQAVGAESVFEVLARWTESVFTFFSQVGDPVEYVFQTDHPGLQKIYDTVTEAGITQPVVPTWVPEGFELVELKIAQIPEKTKIYATLYSQSKKIAFSYTYHVADTANEHSKDAAEATIIEREGIPHYVMDNDGTITVAWAVEKTKCLVSSDCQENILMDVIDSIYTQEELE